MAGKHSYHYKNSKSCCYGGGDDTTQYLTTLEMRITHNRQYYYKGYHDYWKDV